MNIAHDNLWTDDYGYWPTSTTPDEPASRTNATAYPTSPADSLPDPPFAPVPWISQPPSTVTAADYNSPRRSPSPYPTEATGTLVVAGGPERSSSSQPHSLLNLPPSPDFEFAGQPWYGVVETMPTPPISDTYSPNVFTFSAQSDSSPALSATSPGPGPIRSRRSPHHSPYAAQYQLHRPKSQPQLGAGQVVHKLPRPADWQGPRLAPEDALEGNSPYLSHPSPNLEYSSDGYPSPNFAGGNNGSVGWYDSDSPTLDSAATDAVLPYLTMGNAPASAAAQYAQNASFSFFPAHPPANHSHFIDHPSSRPGSSHRHHGVEDSPSTRFSRLTFESPLLNSRQSPPGSNNPHISPLILLAAAHRHERQLTLADPLSNALRLNTDPTPRASSTDYQFPERRTMSKPTVNFQCRCAQCGVDLAHLIFRGDTEAIPFRVVYYCLRCVPLRDDIAEAESEREGSYADTLSAAVDRMQGLPIAPSDPRPRARKERTTPQIVRRVGEDTTICDVCARAIGSGGVVPADPADTVEFGVEVVCYECERRYRRCTDCGGGGGPRLGVGKWRCWELFPEGRKTCQLSHLRLGSLDEMKYDIWPVSMIPAGELVEFLPVAREVYLRHMYATLAIPEVLETKEAMATTSAEVENLALDFFSLCVPMLQQDAPEHLERRRYLALRWSTPTQRKRKVNKSKPAPPPPESSSDDESTEGTLGNLIREGKNLAGFVICELDLLTGSLLLTLTTPWATGDTFDATTILMQKLMQQIKSDILRLNEDRSLRGLAPYPPLEKAWRLTYYSEDGKLTSHLLNRRGFLRSEHYFKKYPEANPEHLFPNRPVFLPPDLLKGWHVLIRKIEEDDDWNARAPVKKRTRKPKASTRDEGRRRR